MEKNVYKIIYYKIKRENYRNVDGGKKDENIDGGKKEENVDGGMKEERAG